MYLIVGLGNPGTEYKGTRHNIGFDVVDRLADRNNIQMNKLKFSSIYGEGRIAGRKVFIVKPTTYMNNSGEAVRDIADFYKIEDENIMVIADDIDIPFASIRIKKKGSGGTHNGLKSIVKLLGSKDFPRLKIGVGEKHKQQDLASFVLGKFSREDLVYIDETVDLAADALELYLREGIDSSMNKYNNKGGKAQE